MADAAFAWVVPPELNELAHKLILILFSQILHGLTLDDETYLPLLEKLIGETEFLQVCYLRTWYIIPLILITVTTACVKRAGAAASVVRTGDVSASWPSGRGVRASRVTRARQGLCGTCVY